MRSAPRCAYESARRAGRQVSVDHAKDDAREQKKEQTKPHSDIAEAVGTKVKAQLGTHTEQTLRCHTLKTKTMRLRGLYEC